MKEILLAILIAGSLLTGCSSEPSGNEATQEPATEEYVVDNKTNELCTKVEEVLAANEYMNLYADNENEYGLYVYDCRDYYRDPENLKKVIENQKAFYNK